MLCSFDAIASIFAVFYCDSSRYTNLINCLKKPNEFPSFVSLIVQNGITALTYKEKAKIILGSLETETSEIDFGVKLVSCHSTASHIIKQSCQNVPTAKDNVTNSNSLCENSSSIQTDSLSGLQDLLSERFSMENLNCERKCHGVKTIITTISSIHLIVEVLKWGKVNKTRCTYVSIKYNRFTIFFSGESTDINQSTEDAPHSSSLIERYSRNNNT